MPKRETSPSEMDGAWSAPGQVLEGLIGRLERSRFQPNARVPRPGFRPNTGELDAWVLQYEDEGFVWTAAFVAEPRPIFMTGHNVEDGIWMDASPSLPSLTLSRDFRRSFEWFISQGPAYKWDDLDFTSKMIAERRNPDYYKFYNKQPVEEIG